MDVRSVKSSIQHSGRGSSTLGVDHGGEQNHIVWFSVWLAALFVLSCPVLSVCLSAWFCLCVGLFVCSFVCLIVVPLFVWLGMFIGGGLPSQPTGHSESVDRQNHRFLILISDGDVDAHSEELARTMENDDGIIIFSRLAKYKSLDPQATPNKEVGGEHLLIGRVS